MVNRVLVIIAGLLGIVICIVYLAIAVILVGDPTKGTQKPPEPTATSTPSPLPTFTVVPTRPRPTNTPYVTATPEPTETPVPTPTATVTRTPTPRPAAPPPPPPPPLPAPYQLDGNLVAWPSCNWTGVYGIVRGSNGQPLKDVQLRVWKSQDGKFVWNSDVVTTDVDGNYSIGLADTAVSGRWFVQVVQNGDASWNMRGFDTSEGCQNGLQKFQMNWQKIR